MNVAYVSNENYVRHLAVSLCSLCDSNMDEEELKIFVISTGIGERSKEKLRRIAKSFGRELFVSELLHLSSRFGGKIDTGDFDISTMGRLFLGECIPEAVEKILYLDCDTVVLKPLKKLWNQALKGEILAAVQEPTIYPEVKAYLHFDQHTPYFNAGVLLIDLKAWREEKTGQRTVDFYKSIAEQSLFNDQDALNGSLCGRIRTLSPGWNFFTNYRYYRYETLCKMQPSYQKISKKSFRHAKSHPAIVHYAGAERPWKAGAFNYYGKAYETYLSMTPFAGAEKERGQEIEMALYHMMLWITPIVPIVRKMFSRAYVRRLIQKRSGRMRGER